MKKPIPFGKYVLLDRLNVGGMAEVFKAKSFGVEGFERLVAVKRILPSIAEDKEFITMFVDEAKIAVQLQHANIAQIFDLGKVGDAYFIALELVQGKDLKTIFERARTRGETIPVPMACYVAMKVCEGLDYAHNRKDAYGRDLQLVHRDVSPQNVLVSYDGEAKIIDFGIAKAAGKAGRTDAGILKGKFGYMSPEQVRGLPLDRRSDVFAMGIVLHEMITGERLFLGSSDFSTLEKVRNVEITPPSTYNKKIPEELEAIVLKALARDLDDRYQTAMDLHDDLQSFLYTSGNFFSRKDLSRYMRDMFAEEIAKNAARDEELRTLEENGSLRALVEDQPAQVSLSELEVVAEDGTRAISEADLEPMNPVRTSGSSAHRISPLRQTMQGMPQIATPPPPPPSTRPPGRDSLRADVPLEWEEDEELSTHIYDKPEGRVGLVGELPEVDSTPRKYTTPPPPPGGPMARTSIPSAPALPSVIASDRPPAMPGNAASPNGAARGSGAPSPFDPTPSPFDPPRPGAGEPTEQTRRPRPNNNTNGLVGATSAVFVALLLLGGWLIFGRGSTTGTVTLSTTPPDAVIFIDGQRANTSSASPFVVRNVAPGQHHVEVQRSGYEARSLSIMVQAGQNLSMPAVELEASQMTPPRRSEGAMLGGADGTGFALTSEPSGAQVRIDDRVLTQRTPLTVSDLEPGTYQIRVTHGSQYAPWAMIVTIAPGQIVTIPRAVLVLQSVSVRFESEPSGAEVELRRGRESRSLGTTPAQTDIELGGEPWTVRMVRRGYRDYEAPLELPTSEPEATHHAVLEQQQRAHVAGPRHSQRHADQDLEAGPEPTPAPSGPGMLTVNTVPWTSVSVDGRSLGNTPLMNIELPAGRHTVAFENDEFGVHESRGITITPGEPTRLILRFAQPEP